MRHRSLLIFVALIALAACTPKAPPTPQAEPVKPASAERQPLYWYDPMEPAQHFDKPGKSPYMDMDLVPKYADQPAAGEASADDGSLHVDPRMLQSLGVRLAMVERGPLAREIRAAGAVMVDEHRIESVQVRAAGWVESLAVRAVGDPVRRGARLASVYSPELLAAQQEFLLAQNAGDAGLRQAARARLALAGLSETQIERIARTGVAERRVEYVAPFDGYVMTLGTRQGASVQPGMALFELADLSTVWINAEVPEAQGAWLKLGDPVQAEVPAWPGERFAGRIDYIYPELAEATRTVKIRIALANRAARLRPGMYASVTLRGAPIVALSLPSEAVIRTGTRSIALVADHPDARSGRFRPVVVRTGIEADGRVQIVDGLKAGEQVVASGQFLIDSEASLSGLEARLGSTARGAEERPATGRGPAATGGHEPAPVCSEAGCEASQGQDGVGTGDEVSPGKAAALPIEAHEVHDHGARQP
jgi:Cu(I)/Ag(I) efflux system membrane fusion protein